MVYTCKTGITYMVTEGVQHSSFTLVILATVTVLDLVKTP